MNMLRFVLALSLLLKASVMGVCPQSNGSFTRVGQTRFFIIHPSQRNGFVTRDEARNECTKQGLKMATVKNLLTMAVLGRQLEQLVFAQKLQDTWYWLDGKYNEQKQQYRSVESKGLEFNLFLYRDPRPIGIGKHITYNNVYQPDVDKQQCLTLALPHPGSADHDQNTTVFFGHHATFDEKDCNSRTKRHAICESLDEACNSNETSTYTLDEGKAYYFYAGHWIFGNRTYIMNWRQRNFAESSKFCESIGLNLLTAAPSDKYLTPHIKMWSREITVAQFWTSMKYNTITKQLLDESGNVVPYELITGNFTTLNTQPKSVKANTLLCVVLSVSFEFIEQMPCSNLSSPGCQWSYFRYVPANCNNYHGSICQHKDHTTRPITWDSYNKKDLTEGLQNEAVTSEFGYMNNTNVLRSKYKQTFGLFYCPEKYRALRSDHNSYITWAFPPTNKTEFYKYDYNERYWVIDDDVYNKTEDSNCTVFTANFTQQSFQQAKCTEWHFYLCMKLGRRPTKKLEGAVNFAPPMEWKPGPQPRVYPILNDVPIECRPHHGNPCQCKFHNRRAFKCEYNSVTNRCVGAWKECPRQYFANGFCQRQGAHIYYAISGIVCNSQASNTRCSIDKTLYAANFGYIEHTSNGTDSRNIKFHRHRDKSEFNDPENIWKYGGQFLSELGIPEKDRFLYTSHMFGTPGYYKRVRCISLTLDLAGNGYYEISFKIGEFFKIQLRTFSIQLNNQYVVNEIGPTAHRTYGYGVELNCNFEISQNETMIELQGHPITSLLQQRKIKLVLCTSKCSYEADDLNFSFNAISVVKFVKQ